METVEAMWMSVGSMRKGMEGIDNTEGNGVVVLWRDFSISDSAWMGEEAEEEVKNEGGLLRRASRAFNLVTVRVFARNSSMSNLEITLQTAQLETITKKKDVIEGPKMLSARKAGPLSWKRS